MIDIRKCPWAIQSVVIVPPSDAIDGLAVSKIEKHSLLEKSEVQFTSIRRVHATFVQNIVIFYCTTYEYVPVD